MRQTLLIGRPDYLSNAFMTLPTLLMLAALGIDLVYQNSAGCVPILECEYQIVGIINVASQHGHCLVCLSPFGALNNVEPAIHKYRNTCQHMLPSSSFYRAATFTLLFI